MSRSTRTDTTRSDLERDNRVRWPRNDGRPGASLRRLFAHDLLALLALAVGLGVAPASANVFSFVQSAGPDLETPQTGETFDFQIHFEQSTNLASLGFSVRTTGGVRIVSVVSSTDCYGPFAPFACDFIPLPQAGLPNLQFFVTDTLAGPWSYVAGLSLLESGGAAAGSVDDGTGPPGGLLATVTVEYLSPGSLEIFENTGTDDQTYSPPQVITPTFDEVAFPTATPTFPLSVSFSDVTGDWDPPISVDLVSVDLAFDPATGDYELTWHADPAHPFDGTFRLNANFYNPDTGSNNPDPAFFNDDFNDITLATPQTSVTLTGNEPRLMAWGAGDRVAPSCPDPLGCPTASSASLSAVGPLSGSAVGLDRLPPQSSVIVTTSAAVPALSAPAVGMLIAVAGGLGSILLRRGRGRPSRE